MILKFNFLLGLFLIPGLFGIVHSENNGLPGHQEGRPEGTAIIITGAAARIPQEAALLENLYRQGMLNDVQFIAGASSGALNTVVLNAILTHRYTWKSYLNLLFTLRNENVYKLNGKKLPVDTEPLRKFLSLVVNETIGYHKIGDLPITSAISITEEKLAGITSKNFRLSNKKINPESDPDLDLVEVLMASTAIPIVFPAAWFSKAPTLPEHRFVDGGVGEDHVPFKGMLDFIKFRGKSFEKVIIVSRKADKKPELSEELRLVGIDDKGILDKLGISLDGIMFKGFIKGLRALQKEDLDLAERTYIYIPDFQNDFMLLDFTNLERQYEVAKEWANRNKPVPLKQYLQNLNQKEEQYREK